MTAISRRNLLKASAAGAVGMAAVGYNSMAVASGNKKSVVIVGGGIGGATAAQYIKKYDPSVDVTIIEANKDYYTCFMSNFVIGGSRSMDYIHFGYAGVADKGINVVHDWVTGIDADKQVVKTKGGKSFGYDKCIVSPGIDFRFDAIEGYDEKVAETIPHAWKAGAQTQTLRDQLTAMKDGGTVVVSPPTNPFRCPPGPYERISQMAAYLKANKPKSKIVVLDPKNKFSKFGLFTDGWRRHYGYESDDSMIDWVSKDNGGTVTAVDAGSMTVTTDSGEKVKADVLNVIPPQKAGKIAFAAGLTNDKGWCPIHAETFESTIHKNIHVVGDSAIASPLPKSGYAANSEAKVCAAAVVSALNGTAMPKPSWVNTCYSVIAPGDGISVAMVYAYEGGKITKVKGSGGLTPSEFDAEMRAREEAYAHSWFKNITTDVFG